MTEPLEHWMQELIDSYEDTDKMTEKQLKILSAAIEVFSEKGYAASSTNEIAQKAGVAEGTIFRHYKTKKDLLLSIVAPIMAKAIAPFTLRDLTKVLDAPYEQYKDLMRAIMLNRSEFVRKHLPVLKIMLQEVPFHPELRNEMIEKVGTKVYERMIPVIERFQADGQLAPMPPAAAFRHSITTILGFLIARYFIMPELDWNDEADIERTIDLMMYGLASPEK